MLDVFACSGFRDCINTIYVENLKQNRGSGSGLNIGALVSDVLPIVLTIAGFVTVIVIIISGIQFVTSGGNPEAAAAARGRLTFALIGFVIIILAFAILQIVNRLFLGTTIV